MTTIQTKRHLAYAAEDAANSAVGRIDTTIERAERMILMLKDHRDSLANPTDPYSGADRMGWALNEVMNFVRNIDPDMWAGVQAKLAVVAAVSAISEHLPE